MWTRIVLLSLGLWVLGSSIACDPCLVTPCEGEGEGEGEGEAEHASCQEECVNDADCASAGVGSAECTDSRCVGVFPPGCASDAECVADRSGWGEVESNGEFTDCSSDAPCGAGFSVCVDLFGGSGRCASDETSDLGGDCASGGLVDQVGINVTDIDGIARTVCANPGADDAVCGDFNQCEDRCSTDSDCGVGLLCRDDGECVFCLADGDCAGNPSQETCYFEVYCGCTGDEDCAGNVAGENCNEDLGICGCDADDDCTGSALGDICFDTGCGCSAVADCDGSRFFDGTTFVCE